MGSLFLSGGGDQDQTKVIDAIFIEKIDKTKPLLYIPIAMDSSQFDDCYQWIIDVFNPFGITVMMWTDLNNKRIDDLTSFSAVYIGGGNTYRLLNAMRASGFDQIIYHYVQDNGILYGGSAGAIIMGTDIKTCDHTDPNHVHLQDCSGLELVNSYAIWCHYKETDEELILRYIQTSSNPVIALPEETGILLEDHQAKVIGTLPAYMFKDGTKSVVQPDSFI
ncbi:Type 1 glutamine amidotransferase-like domain-containing protein [Jeotgalibacillus haloalkalitolerans]|uniref:Type 1 glutamine amidotransferase-like domain-containing protein n=1 Tax=Jeotgalibacillus haloalkalitolerans TaxID=3104292 RepID=UPI002ACBF4D6|nr:Type 1 glutamine amidotransferase-like domain-containing protein [Jeotgalibacillus sp. HH7-29]